MILEQCKKEGWRTVEHYGSCPQKIRNAQQSVPWMWVTNGQIILWLFTRNNSEHTAMHKLSKISKQLRKLAYSSKMRLNSNAYAWLVAKLWKNAHGNIVKILLCIVEAVWTGRRETSTEQSACAPVFVMGEEPECCSDVSQTSRVAKKRCHISGSSSYFANMHSCVEAMARTHGTLSLKTYGDSCCADTGP